MKKVALLYQPNLDFRQIFSDPGESIDVFIPANLYASNIIPVQSEFIWGSRPYAPCSDIAAISVHMGILFPLEKPKKAQPILLFTSPSAIRFGKGETLNLSNQIRVDEDLNLLGVVLTVFSCEPQKAYPSSFGFRISSQTSTESFAFSIDIASYYFCSEYEPIPPLLNLEEGHSIIIDHGKVQTHPISYERIKTIVKKMDLFDYMIQRQNNNQLTILYDPSIFQSETVYDEFSVTFFGYDWQVNITKGNGSYSFRILNQNYEDTVFDGINFSQFNFGQNEISFNNKSYNQIESVLLEPISNFVPPTFDTHRINESEHTDEHRSENEEEESQKIPYEEKNEEEEITKDVYHDSSRENTQGDE